MSRNAVLDRLAPWATTGIGSLPFGEPMAAARHAATAYDLPFCPQLPRVEGDMIAEWLGADPGRCGWSPQRDRERPVAWDAWLGVLRHAPPSDGVVKLQTTGPLTLAIALERASGGRATRSGVLALAGELSGWLAANLRGQADELRRMGLEALLVVDEPGLAAVAGPGADEAWDPLRSVAGAWGLHLCCAVPWAVVDAARPDLVSFDLAATPIDAAGAAAIARHVERGGGIAWGVLSAHRPEGPRHAFLRLTAALGRVHVGAERSLLTAGCGTGRLAEARELQVAAALRELQAVRRPAPTAIHGSAG